MSKPEPPTKLAPAVGERLSVAHPSGAVVLEVLVGADTLRVALTTDAELELACRRFRVTAEDGIELLTNGDLVSSVAGDVQLRCAGELDQCGEEVRLRARRGELRLDANDDVRVRGERILLND